MKLYPESKMVESVEFKKGSTVRIRLHKGKKTYIYRLTGEMREEFKNRCIHSVGVGEFYLNFLKGTSCRRVPDAE